MKQKIVTIAVCLLLCGCQYAYGMKAWAGAIEPVGCAGGVAWKSTDESAKNFMKIFNRFGDVIQPDKAMNKEIVTLEQGDSALCMDTVIPWDRYGKVIIIAFDEDMNILNYIEMYDKDKQVRVVERLAQGGTPIETKYPSDKTYKVTIDVDGRVVLFS